MLKKNLVEFDTISAVIIAMDGILFTCHSMIEIQYLKTGQFWGTKVKKHHLKLVF